MSLADEVLAEHQKRECFCGCGDVGCPLCGDGWPCESVRLALSLKAAEQVVEAARKLTDEMLRADDERIFSRLFESVTEALAEYDKGGQG